MRLWLPRGNTLPRDMWEQRHRGIVALLWVHAVVIPVFGFVRDVNPLHILAESLVVPATAAYASWPGASRRLRTLAASVGLLSASAILVHFSGGVIEVHFHFFVMVAVVSLYQDWLPFLAAVAYVFVHHAVLGSVDPSSVFNHPAAVNHPWRWAAIHALFIAGISVACLVAWRLNENSLGQQRAAEERLRQETQVVDTLQHVGKSLASELDLHTVLQRVTDAATELTNAQFGAFFYNQVDESGEAYQLYTLSGVPAERFANFPMPRATEIFAPTFRGEAPVRHADVTAEPTFAQNEPYYGMPEGHLPVHSYLAVPVVAHDGEVYGGLFFGHEEVGVFSEIDERMVVGIASHATVAIDNARLYDSERTARAAAEFASRRLVVLAQVGQVLAASIDVNATLADLVLLLIPELADSCAVYLVEDRRLVTAAAAANYRAPDSLSGDSVDLDHPVHPVAQVVRSGTPQFLPEISRELIDASLGDTAQRSFVDDTEPTSAIIVPLTFGSEVIGALALGTIRSSGRRLLSADLDLAAEVARRAAVAIQHARLYTTQRDVAETLQHSLLPDVLPHVPGLETAARYVPGGPGAEVGGDWYDVLSFGDGTLGLAMGDVVGRGTPAASLMGQIRNALRAYALETRSPRSVVQRLNTLVTELAPHAAMATLVYAVYDMDACTLTLANAGHPPPVLADPDGNVGFVEGGLGPPLGAVSAPVYTDVSCAVLPGSTVVMYTDGLVEDRLTPLEVGLERMRALVTSGPTDAEPLVDHILKGALAGRSNGDDAALLAMRVCPTEREIRLTLPRRPEVIRALRTTLRRQLHQAGASEQEEFEILVAAGEACANAIQHAGPMSATFDFEATVDDEVRIVVRDHGRWRDQRPSDGGRGFSIMEHFMDEVDVNRSSSGTEVVLRRALSSADARVSR
ncbi:MAG TPA: SpoIIE family protein phosphatase [Acidimicrobiales bacterium]|nr:SpoIIE family protein phosphatase [Acidimicrobiales bacterium]